MISFGLLGCVYVFGIILSPVDTSFSYDNYAVDIENTASLNSYQTYQISRIIYGNDNWNPTFATYTFSNMACYLPKLTIQTHCLHYATWSINSLPQSNLYSSSGCTTAYPLQNFELFNDKTLGYHAFIGENGQNLEIYHQANFYSCNGLNDMVYLRLSCLRPPILLCQHTSFTQDYYININPATFNLNTHKSFTTTLINTEPQESIYTYFRITNESCYLPQLTVSVGPLLNASIIDIYVGLNGIEKLVKTACYVGIQNSSRDCLQNFYLTPIFETDNIDNAIEIRIESFDVHDGLCPTNTMDGNIEILCSLLNEQIFEVDIEATDNKFEYESFTQLINVTEASQPIFAKYTIKNEKCKNPLLTIKATAADFDQNGEFIDLYYLIDNNNNEEYHTQCTPNGDGITCSNRYICENAFELSQDIEQEFIVKILPITNDPITSICNFIVEVTLQCYPIEVADDKVYTFEIDIANNDNYGIEYDHTFPIYSDKTAQNVVINISILNDPCYLPHLTIDLLDIDFNDQDEFVHIYVNNCSINICDPHSNSCNNMFKCIDKYNLKYILSGLSISDSIQIYLDNHENNRRNDNNCNNNLSLLGNITLTCTIPPIVSNTNNLVVIEPEFTDINHTLSLTSVIPGEFVGSFMFWFDKSDYKCNQSFITVNTLSTDYNTNDEYLQVEISYANTMNDTSKCDPGLADCVTWYNCLDSYMIYPDADNLILVSVTAYGAGAICGLSYHTTVTLNCNLPPITAPTTAFPTTVTAMPTLSPTNTTNTPIPIPTTTPTQLPTAVHFNCQDNNLIKHPNWNNINGTFPDYNFSLIINPNSMHVGVNIELTLDYIGYSYTDNNEENTVGTAYIFDFEQFHSTNSKIEKPGNCANRLSSSYINKSWSEYWNYSEYPSEPNVLGSIDYLAYGPTPYQWKLYPQTQCTKIHYSGSFSWSELMSCINYDGDALMEIEIDEQYINMSGRFFLSVISPFNMIYDTGIYYRNDLVFSKPFQISILKSVHLLNSVGTNIFVITIFQTARTFNDKTNNNGGYDIIISSQTAEYLQLTNPVLLSYPTQYNQWQIDSVNNGLNGSCIVDSNGICVQFWIITIDGLNCPVTFNGNFGVEWIAKCNENNIDDTECDEYLNNNNNQIVLTFDLSYSDRFECDDKNREFIQYYANIHFYSDNTFNMIDNNIIYNRGTDTIYIEIVVNDLMISLDSSIINVWICSVSNTNDELSIIN
eukprot:227404_1